VDVFPEMVHLFEILVEKHPTETIAFVKQVIFEKPVSATLRLIRKILPSLPNNVQVSIREAMENAYPPLLVSPLPSSKSRSKLTVTKQREKK
jgi:hypothetical protein